MLYEDEGGEPVHLAPVGLHMLLNVIYGTSVTVNCTTEKSPTTRPLLLATDDSLTKVGQRSLAVVSLRSLLKLRTTFFLQTEDVHTSRTDSKDTWRR